MSIDADLFPSYSSWKRIVNIKVYKYDKEKLLSYASEFSNLTVSIFQAMFTLYRIGFCSVSKVAPAQCEQELMFCCGAEVVPKRSQCEQKPYPLCNLQRSLLI